MQRHLPEYRRSLEKASLLITGLELLNTLPELSPAVGGFWRQRLNSLEVSLSSCEITARKLAESLIQRPSCPECGLSLTNAPRPEELQELVRGIQFDLAAQTRRLSNLLVRRLVDGTQNQQLDDLLRIAEASDLTALSNTLNPELVEFIGQALR